MSLSRTRGGGYRIAKTVAVVFAVLLVTLAVIPATASTADRPAAAPKSCKQAVKLGRDAAAAAPEAMNLLLLKGASDDPDIVTRSGLPDIVNDYTDGRLAFIDASKKCLTRSPRRNCAQAIIELTWILERWDRVYEQVFDAAAAYQSGDIAALTAAADQAEQLMQSGELVQHATNAARPIKRCLK